MSGWVAPSLGYDYTQHIKGLYNNHEALTRMAVQWVGICSDFHATMCSGIPLRLYRSTKTRGKVKAMRGRRVKRRAKLEYLKDPQWGAGKSAQYAEEAGDIEEIVDSPILDHMNHPNRSDTGTEYCRRLFKMMPLTGNGYELLVEPDAGSDGFLQRVPLLPIWTRVAPGENDIIEAYIYGKSKAIERRYTPEEVIHHKHLPGIDNLYYGTGCLHNVIAESHVFASAIAYELANMENGMRPGDIAIECAEETTPVQVEQIRAELRRRYQGARQAGTPLILVDAKAVPLMRTSKEMEYREGMEQIRKMTLAAFGIPESLLSRADGSIQIGGGEAQSAAYSVYARSTMLPSLRSVADRWNTELLPILGYEPGEVWFAYDDPCPEDQVSDVDRIVKLYCTGSRPVISLNEARAELEMEPVDGGDEIQTQQPEPQGGDPFGKHYTKSKEKPTKAERELEAARAAEALLAKGLIDWFGMVKTEVVEQVNTTTMTLNLNLSIPTRKAFFELTKPGLEEAMVSGYNAGAVELSLEPVKEVGEAAARAITNYQGKLLTAVTETTQKEVRAALAESLANGESHAETTQRVAAVLGEGSEVRAEAIASTESARAFNMAREQAYIKEGNVTEKEWLPSGNPCPVCKTLSGQTRPVGRPFVNSGETITLKNGQQWTNDWEPIYGPPAHTRCRCGITSVTRQTPTTTEGLTEPNQ